MGMHKYSHSVVQRRRDLWTSVVGGSLHDKELGGGGFHDVHQPSHALRHGDAQAPYSALTSTIPQPDQVDATEDSSDPSKPSSGRGSPGRRKNEYRAARENMTYNDEVFGGVTISTWIWTLEEMAHLTVHSVGTFWTERNMMEATTFIDWSLGLLHPIQKKCCSFFFEKKCCTFRSAFNIHINKMGNEYI